MSIKPVIFGLRQKKILPEEKEFLKKHNPLGIILFSRNIDSPEQVQELVMEIRKTLGRSDAPILIDQEGGKVTRLRPPHWVRPPAAAVFGRIAEENLSEAKKAAYINGQIIGHDLVSLGINVDCAPVLDVPIKGAHSVIGNRAFSTDKNIVTELGQSMADGLMSTGIVPIIKHIPGHGRGLADSHLELPIVKDDYSTLKENDFYPFYNLRKLPWAMTAHIVYEAIDPKLPATYSPEVIKVIREVIGFKGLLISDCITMRALTGSMEERATKSFQAGVDIVIHSFGDLDEMRAVASIAPNMSENQLDLLKLSYHQAEQHYHLKPRSVLQSELMHYIDKYNLSEVMENIFDPTEQNI